MVTPIMPSIGCSAIINYLPVLFQVYCIWGVLGQQLRVMPGMPHKAHHCNQCQQRAEQQFERNHTLLFGAAGVISLQPELIRLYF